MLMKAREKRWGVEEESGETSLYIRPRYLLACPRSGAVRIVVSEYGVCLFLFPACSIEKWTH